MNKEFIGSCLCGNVEFKISGNFESFFLCHCQRCRKDTGSAHGANLFSQSAEIKWIKGVEKITTFCVPDTRHKRSFCSQCGSSLPSLQMNGELLVAPAGCLDTPIDIKPNAHVFYADRAEWDNDLECVHKLDGLPR